LAAGARDATALTETAGHRKAPAFQFQGEAFHLRFRGFPKGLALQRKASTGFQGMRLTIVSKPWAKIF